jgi:hypothetical protein
VNYFFFRVEDSDLDKSAVSLDLCSVGAVSVEKGTGRSNKDVWGIIKTAVGTVAELRTLLILNCSTPVHFLQKVESFAEGKTLSKQTAFW